MGRGLWEVQFRLRCCSLVANPACVLDFCDSALEPRRYCQQDP